MADVKVAIEKITLKGTFEAKMEFNDELEVFVCYFSDNHNELILISFDLMQLSVSFCDELRSQLSQRCKLQADAIITHCIHTHTAPSENEIRNFGISELTNQLVVAIERARKSAKVAAVSFAQIDTMGRFNVNRRKKINSSDSTFTVWYGYDDNAGRPDGTWQVKKRLEMLTGRTIEAKEFGAPIIYDEPTDGWIKAIRFQSETGQPIGTIIRYAAHPCGAGHTPDRKYSADFPGVIRKIIAERFGGQCCFFTGACGNIAPWSKGDWGDVLLPEDGISISPLWMPHKSDDECRREVYRLGRQIADTITPMLDSTKFERIEELAFANRSSAIAVRDDILADIGEANALADRHYREFLKMRPNSSITELKSLADKINFLRSHKYFYSEYYYLNRKQAEAKEVRIDMPIARLNDIAVVGFPGEVFWQVQTPVREYAKNRDIKSFCFTEANGDIGYIPTSSEKPNDDYECYCSITAPGTSEKLAELAKNILGSIS